MPNSLVNTVEVTRSPQDSGIEMLQFALPIPADHREKVRALTYLHETVDFYIKDFCDPNGRVLNPLEAEDAVPRYNPHAITLPQAVQIFLTFYICLFI
ncbi:MAG: hypothetical protein OEM93_14480 [Rhodospirillales bacterium]|nr:hypothetical protein [Rhodospirillales bacterium]